MIFVSTFKSAKVPAQTKSVTKCVAWAASPSAAGKAERQTKVAAVIRPPMAPSNSRPIKKTKIVETEVTRIIPRWIPGGDSPKHFISAA